MRMRKQGWEGQNIRGRVILQSSEGLRTAPLPECLLCRPVQITVCTSPTPHCDLTHGLEEKTCLSSSAARPSLRAGVGEPGQGSSPNKAVRSRQVNVCDLARGVHVGGPCVVP